MNSEEFREMCPRINIKQAKKIMQEHGIDWEEFERECTATREGDTWDTTFVLAWLGY